MNSIPLTAIPEHRPNDLGNYRGKRTPRKVDVTPLTPEQRRAGLLAAPRPGSRRLDALAALSMLAIVGLRAR
jgi:hypothetical protein